MWSRCWKKVVFGIFVSHLGYGPFYIAVVSSTYDLLLQQWTESVRTA